MRHKTMALRPLWLAASTLVKVTGFGLHNAHIAAGELLHAHKAMALRIAFFGLFAAVTAEDVTCVGQGQRLAN